MTTKSYSEIVTEIADKSRRYTELRRKNMLGELEAVDFTILPMEIDMLSILQRTLSNSARGIVSPTLELQMEMFRSYQEDLKPLYEQRQELVKKQQQFRDNSTPVSSFRNPTISY